MLFSLFFFFLHWHRTKAVGQQTRRTRRPRGIIPFKNVVFFHSHYRYHNLLILLYRCSTSHGVLCHLLQNKPFSDDFLPVNVKLKVQYFPQKNVLTVQTVQIIRRPSFILLDSIRFSSDVIKILNLWFSEQIKNKHKKTKSTSISERFVASSLPSSLRHPSLPENLLTLFIINSN